MVHGVMVYGVWLITHPYLPQQQRLQQQREASRAAGIALAATAVKRVSCMHRHAPQPHVCTAYGDTHVTDDDDAHANVAAACVLRC